MKPKIFFAVFCVYVVNKEKQLTGALSLHEMLRQHPDTPLYKFMTQKFDCDPSDNAN